MKYARWDGTRWNIETVESGGACCPSLVLDASGNPSIAFNGSGIVHHARFDGISWTVKELSSAGCRAPSLALDPSGDPVISDYGLAIWNGIGWDLKTQPGATSSCGGSRALRITSKGRPAIIYYDDREETLNFAQWFAFAILRGESPTSLLKVAHSPLPWTDPESVILQWSRPLLFYRVEDVGRIALIKDKFSITISSF